MEKVLIKYNSFAEQEEDDVNYWSNLSGEKKLEYLEYIRWQNWYLTHDDPPRFQRVYSITKQA